MKREKTRKIQVFWNFIQYTCENLAVTSGRRKVQLREGVGFYFGWHLRFYFYFSDTAFLISLLKSIIWHNPWCSDDPLKHHFLELFNKLVQKDSWLANFWDGNCWNPRFRRYFSDRKLSAMESRQLLNPFISGNQCVGHVDLEDWKKGFILHQLISLDPCLKGAPFLSCQADWNLRVPSKVWEAAWDKILTIDQLMKWGLSLVNRSYLYEDDMEFHCKWTSELWSLV